MTNAPVSTTPAPPGTDNVNGTKTCKVGGLSCTFVEVVVFLGIATAVGVIGYQSFTKQKAVSEEEAKKKAERLAKAKEIERMASGAGRTLGAKKEDEPSAPATTGGPAAFSLKAPAAPGASASPARAAPAASEASPAKAWPGKAREEDASPADAGRAASVTEETFEAAAERRKALRSGSRAHGGAE